MLTCVVLQWHRCCVAHQSRLSQGIIFHCKTIIYTFFFRAVPQDASLAYDTTHDTSYTYIFTNTLHMKALPTAHIGTGWISKSGINSWKQLAYTCYVAEFETYVPYVYIWRAWHKIWANLGSEQAAFSMWRFRAPLTFREGAWAKMPKTGRTFEMCLKV
jgi:hypothetical protein